MKTVSALYEGRTSIQLLIDKGTIKVDQPYLIRIYTAIASKDEATLIAKEIKGLFPQGHIFGCSSMGIMFQDVIYEDKTMVLFDSFDDAEVTMRFFSWENRATSDLAKEFATFAEQTSAQVIHTIFSDKYTKAHEFVCNFNLLNKKTLLIGGIAGDIVCRNEDSYVFDHTGVKEYSVMAAAISGGRLKSKSWVNIAHEPISEVFTITSSDGIVIRTIENVDSKDWIMEHLGLYDLKEFSSYELVVANDEIVRFPIILEGHNGASRFLRYDKGKDAICQYNSEVSDGCKFCMGYTNPKSIIKNVYAIIKDFSFQPIESLFFYSCFFRKYYLNNCAQWEMSPFRGNGLCGAFLMGEIGTIKNVNEYLNGSSVLVGLAENDVFIEPDMIAFSEIRSVEDETKDLLNFVLLKQKSLLNASNQKLLQELMLHQEMTKNTLYYDSVTKLPNFLKFKDDAAILGLNKLCIIRVENLMNLLSFIRHDGYYAALNREISAIMKYLKTLNDVADFYFYSLSDNVVVIAGGSDVSDDEFKNIAMELFKQFHFFTCDDKISVLINQFILVSGEKDLMETALTALRSGRSAQSPFLIYAGDDVDEPQISDEFKTIGLLNRAIENNGVEPYFQGIYDNARRSIFKYEALMRIKDVDGSIYAPAQFMSVAKKYHLYTYLSLQMIGKTLDLFQDRPEMLGINISALDIQSDIVQKLIFEKLDGMSGCSKIIFEIIEDEYFGRLDKLNAFISKVRRYGVKIAVDDFGVGYTNFREMIAIKPDYIKICGEIVRKIGKDEINDMVIDTIVFLCGRMHAKLIAEYVENEEIQRFVEARGIDYSQGYYFSVPGPYDVNVPPCP